MLLNPVINSVTGKISLAPESVEAEVVQNVRMIITTVRGTVPLFRDFGLDSTIIDSPTLMAQAKISTEIIRQVRKYEPRAKITSLKHDVPEIGHLRPILTVAVKGVR